MGYFLSESLEELPRAEACGTQNPLRGPNRRVESGYRFYNPETGRWLNRDPVGEYGGLNTYGFVGNRPVGNFDVLGLEWDVERNKESTADAKCDCGDTVDELAEEIKLDPSEFERWLQSADGLPLPATSSTKMGSPREFKIPNEAHITQGESGSLGYDVSGWLMGRKDSLIKEYEKRRYAVVDHTPGHASGQQKPAVQNVLMQNRNIYVWAHYGHGVFGHAGNLLFNVNGVIGMGAPSEFLPHHKLSEIVLYACSAGKKRSEWEKHLAPGGVLWASEIPISAADPFIYISLKGPYSPLKKSVKK